MSALRARFIRTQRVSIRPETLGDTRITANAVQDELTLGGTFESRVQSLDVLKDRRVLLAGVLEIDRPFRDW